MKNNLPSFGTMLLSMSMIFVGALSVQGQDLLYDNGSAFNIPGPPQVSMLQDASLGMGTYGFGAAVVNGFSVGDDFVLAADADVGTIDFYAYQTGSSTATINTVYVRVFNGNPSSGGTLVWGDTSTNRFAASVMTGGYRQLESAPGDTSRQLQKVTVNTPGLSLTAGTYWVVYSLGGTGASGPWVPAVTITGQSTTGNGIQHDGTAYTVLTDVGGQGLPFQIYGEGGSSDPFPAPYCEVSGLSSVEPITHVVFADIDNTSPAPTSSPRHEDFTAIIGNVTVGESYDFTVEGYTGGNFTNSVRVYVDWNQDGDFTDEGEYYYIGTIQNSTGEDGIQATAPIVVPADALPGNTRMRVIKKFLASDPSPNDGCTGGSSFGQAEDYTLNVSTGGGGSDEDCGQGDDSNGFENGFNITGGGSYRNADDFVVSAGNTLNIQQIELNVFASSAFSEMNFYIYADEAGLPGAAPIQTLTNVPVTTVAIGANFGYTIYATFADVNISLTEGTYWLQPESNGSTAFWEVTSTGSLGSVVVTSESGGPWTPDVEGMQAVFKLHCEPVTPPEEQCLLAFSFIEPITRVIFANVDNSSDVNSTIAIEDFTSITASIEKGQSYDMALEGTTGGNYTDYFTAWIDWNQNGSYSDPGEMYEIGSITNSNGADGQQAVWPITIPVDALVGETTMRIIKNWDSSPTNPCGSYSFGQAEDYSINVSELGVGDVNNLNFAYYPNPVKDVLNINAQKAVKTVDVYSLTGQKVLNNVKVSNGQINLNALNPGTYVFKVTLEGGQIETFKIIKK